MNNELQQLVNQMKELIAEGNMDGLVNLLLDKNVKPLEFWVLCLKIIQENNFMAVELLQQYMATIRIANDLGAKIREIIAGLNN